MKKSLIFISFLSLFAVRSMACAELNGASLFAEDADDYISLQEEHRTLTQEEFFATPALTQNMDYEACKNTLFAFEIILATKTNQPYILLYSTDDSCDGGNSFGAILNDRMDRVIGDIADSDFYCYEK
ncbi:MAG: hypothetical protein H6621_02650 [Halobacteriovoraceae bacterium]|nr:hypothetical protein [Halobacteriovoraceae bacterium]MCB9093943.1 hypothetical protein [Halobacteriovoraceae bacterium]